MNRSNMIRGSVIAALAAALIAVPATADAQGRRDRGNDRPELIRRSDDRRDDDRREDRRGPPFCRNGRGHPVHGMQWCYDKGFAGYGDVLLDRRDDRRDDRRRSGSYERGGSYERAHEEFHLRHDRQCRMRAAERPLDVQWQIRVRSECRERHMDWHRRAGQPHQ